MTDTVLEFRQVHKAYGAQAVLKGVDLAVPAGQFFGLVGVNGAGKTTLIKGLLDFAGINTGEISIFGRDHRHTAARDRLAYIPERFVPPYFLRGADFLRYMSDLHGVAYEPRRVAEELAALDLSDQALTKPVGSLSKGMAQKLGLAACMLSDKPLLILDEPMSGLDPKARALFKQRLMRARGEGRTLFFSTHLLNDVEALCDSMAVLHEGRLRFVGSPQRCCELYQGETLEQAYLSCIGEQGEAGVA